MPPVGEQPHLNSVGGARGVALAPEDFEAMDLALSLVPELRVAVLAIRLARQANVQYPLTSANEVAKFAGGKTRLAGGHKLTTAEIGKFLIKTDFPIEHEGALASAVFLALSRCRQRESLRAALDRFDTSLG